jgi:hypothetical protein
MLRGGRYPSPVQGMVKAVHHAQQEQSNSGNQRDRSQGRSQDLIEIRHDLCQSSQENNEARHHQDQGEPKALSGLTVAMHRSWA